jgi:hypothetical protein
MLEKVAKTRGVSADTIKEFNEQMAINIFSNTFHDHSVKYELSMHN